MPEAKDVALILEQADLTFSSQFELKNGQKLEVFVVQAQRSENSLPGHWVGTFSGKSQVQSEQLPETEGVVSNPRVPGH